MKPQTSRLTIFAIVACGVLAVAFVATAYWQRDVHSSKLSDAESHEAIAASVQHGKAEGGLAAELLRQYVETGDTTLLVEMQVHTEAGVQDLTNAVSAAGGDSNGFLDQGTQFVQAAGQVIALRQGGDVQGATGALEQLAPSFETFIATQDEFIASEHAQASADRSDASQANTNALWLAITAAALACCAVLGLFVVARRGPSSTSLDAVPTA
ncbi:MAG: hypothetical protein WD904_02395 [Dehalococcoidia bacterium]